LLAISALFPAAGNALKAVPGADCPKLEKDGSRAAAHVNRLVAKREA